MRIGTVGLIVCAILCANAGAAEKAPRTVHVFVALCDNASQGIVPVPPKIGNGDDPASNLYWGAMYGVKTFFKKSADWKQVSSVSYPTGTILERCVFLHKDASVYLVADAYRGSEIKKAVEDFFTAAAGRGAKELTVDGRRIETRGGADLIVYVGHDGLMEFRVKIPSRNKEAAAKGAIVLACMSKPYFQPGLSKLGCKSVLLTTGLMAPEAYTLEAALAGWIAGETGNSIRDRAARAYHQYQKCGLTAATRLFVSEE
jgi:hypothetical protein